MTSTDTVLICGFGLFGELHARAWRRLDPAIRLMVADPSQAALNRAAQLGIPAEGLSTDAASLVGRADMVAVVAPPALHLPLALMALEAGKPVLIEKPAVTTVAEAQALMGAIKDVPTQIGMVLRAHPLVTQAKAMLASGEIGELVAIEGNFSGWKRMRADSSLVENDGVHFLDLMRHFAGHAIEAVSASSWSRLADDVVDDIVIEL